jgi:hypothetical protein
MKVDRRCAVITYAELYKIYGRMVLRGRAGFVPSTALHTLMDLNSQETDVINYRRVRRNLITLAR